MVHPEKTQEPPADEPPEQQPKANKQLPRGRKRMRPPPEGVPVEKEERPKAKRRSLEVPKNMVRSSPAKEQLQTPWKDRLRPLRTTPPNPGPQESNIDNHNNTAEEDYFKALENGDMSLFLMVRELVENSLDATDDTEHPYIIVVIEEFRRKFLKSQEEFSKAKRRPGENAKKCYGVSCQDNGVGFKDLQDIKNQLGKFYCFSKPILQQARGKFGIGVKMPFIYSFKSTSVAVSIRSAASHYRLCLKGDKIYSVEHEARKDYQVGTHITMCALGNGKENIQMIKQYLELIPLVNPDVIIDFQFTSPVKGKVTQTFRSLGLNTLIPEEKLALFDPRSINYNNLMQAILYSEHKTLEPFLKNNFMNIDDAAASNMIKEMKLKSGPETELTSMTGGQVSHLLTIFQKYKYPPSGKISSKGLSPVGKYFTSSVHEYVAPVKLSSSTRTHAYNGHPFVVEAVIAIGSTRKKKGLNIYRFANKAPLVLEEDADLITKIVKHEIKWKTYGIQLLKDAVDVFVSIVSTKIPYNNILKEYLCNSDVVKKAVKETLIECCEDLRQNNTALQYSLDKFCLKGTEVLREYLPSGFDKSQLEANLMCLAKNQNVENKLDDAKEFRKNALARKGCLLMFEDFDLDRTGALYDIEIELNGNDLSLSFDEGTVVEQDVVNFLGRILFHDDNKGKTNFNGGFRFFVHTKFTELIINEKEYSIDAALSYIDKYLDDIFKATLIFIPILRRRHWVAFCLNMDDKRIDVMDSLLFTEHEFLSDVLTSLEELLSACWEDRDEKQTSKCWKQVPNFQNWDKHYVQVDQEVLNDCGVYVMKFMEFWNGRELKFKIDNNKGDDYRAEYCHYMLRHKCNKMCKELVKVDKGKKRRAGNKKQLNPRPPDRKALDDAIEFRNYALARKMDCLLMFEDFDLDGVLYDTELNGNDLSLSFRKGTYVEQNVVNFWGRILFHDDNKGRTNFNGGFRFFVHTKLTELFIDEKEYSIAAALPWMEKYLDAIFKATLIFIPIVRGMHWVAFCLNMDEKRIGVMDSLLFEGHEFSSDVLTRLQELLSVCWEYWVQKQTSLQEEEPSKRWKQVPNFQNWKKHYVQVDRQVYNDCGVYVMKFMEFWNGRELNFKIDKLKGDGYRAEYCLYMLRHECNKMCKLHVMEKGESSKEIPEHISHTGPSEKALDKMRDKTNDFTLKDIPEHVFKERTFGSDEKIKNMFSRSVLSDPLKGISLLKYRNTHTGRATELNGEKLYGSFAQGQCIENMVMDFFCGALFYDDMKHDIKDSSRPRVFLDSTITCLLHNNDTGDDTQMGLYLKNYWAEASSLSEAKLIFLPFKQNSHWWLYCLNIEKECIDVFDAHTHSNGTYRDGEQSYISFFVSALRKISPKIPNFIDFQWNSRHIETEKQIHQDYGIFIMKYMECWDGEKLNCVIDPDKEDDYREVYMNYMPSHSTNILAGKIKLKDNLPQQSFDKEIDSNEPPPELLTQPQAMAIDCSDYVDAQPSLGSAKTDLFNYFHDSCSKLYFGPSLNLYFDLY